MSFERGEFDRSAFFDFCQVMLVVVVLGMGLVGLIVGVAMTGDYLSCRAFGNATGHEVKWRLGCYAKVGDAWVPSEFVYGKAIQLRERQ